ncbi:hypothetical protein VTN77DRAFT_8297 [Rasamsonia byssochlamydoides]|uniref:uncharacterized protein n=1 Tax=Rasamsonia byssochlamydoides TaxID=89139 RepID=UPI003742A67A
MSTSERRLLLMRQMDYQRNSHVSPFVVTTTTGHTRLPLEAMYDFCLKGCAMYITAPLGQGSPLSLTQHDLLAMFDHLCERIDWDAHPDAVLGDFPCKFLACSAPDSPREIAEILETHRSICSQIRARQGELDAEDAATPGANPAQHARYRLHPLFRALLVIMDRPDWHEHEVQLVRTGDDDDLRCGPIDFDPLRFDFYVDDEGDILRGNFKRVMSLIMDWKQREDDAR